ncbi:MAG: four helix bundle protein [Patescibacteria group bacterium]|nr:four helix bundle protein [Patescibacteria group bacterium]
MDNDYKPIKDFTDLYAWQVGHELVLLIYKHSQKFPKEELFGLTNQMRRSAVSVTSNIAEGFSRKTAKDKSHFYYMSKGSLTELQDQLHIAKDVGYINEDIFLTCITKTTDTLKLINSLITSCNKHFS